MDRADLAQVHADVVFVAIAFCTRGNGGRWLDLLGHFNIGQGRRVWAAQPGAAQPGHLSLGRWTLDGVVFAGDARFCFRGHLVPALSRSGRSC